MTIATVVLLATVLLATVSTPTLALAQQDGKTYRVGYLLMVPAPPPGAPRWGPITNAFLARLASLGYVEGKNLVLEMRLAGDQYERLPDLAAELVRVGSM